MPVGARRAGKLVRHRAGAVLQSLRRRGQAGLERAVAGKEVLDGQVAHRPRARRCVDPGIPFDLPPGRRVGQTDQGDGLRHTPTGVDERIGPCQDLSIERQGGNEDPLHLDV